MTSSKSFIQLSVVLFIIQSVVCDGSIKIGALLDQETEDAKFAFEYAVDYINYENNDNLEAVVEVVDPDNEFVCAQKLCEVLEQGVAAIFGPGSSSSAIHVNSVLDAKDMPHIEVRPDPEPEIRSLNIHPDPATIRSALIDLVKIFDWQGFTIIYESGPWLPHLAELLKVFDAKGFTITVKQLDLKLPSNNFRQVLRHVKLSEAKNIIIDCSIELLPEVLKQAQQVGLMSDQHNILVTCLDFHTLDLEPYQYGGTNITGLRLVDPEDPETQKIMEFFEMKHNDLGLELPESLTANYIRVDTALMFDAVLLFSKALETLRDDLFETMSLQCSDTTSWKYGLSLMNSMSTTEVHGLTRTVKLDTNGNRTEFTLDLIELAPDGIQKFGTWNATHGLNISRATIPKISPLNDGSLQNKSFIVITALSKPYGMLKDSAEKLSGNDRFEGFGIELIHELSLMLGFNYTFVLQEDGVYGSLKNGQWNGMLREILEYRADLAITDLTITSEREGGVDFTMPFMNLGISILYRKPTKEAPSLFSFMSPFSKEVWLYLGLAYLGVSISLFILGRLSPVEWDNPYPCIEEPETLENQFSLANSMWFTIGALLQQGSEIAPKSPSTRTVASIWWFFTLIMVSSYTANLAAFLTVEQVATTINNADDLAHSNIPYGAKRDGSTINFFKDAVDNEVYQKMYAYMRDHPNDLTSSNDEGLERVKTQNYAYLMESTSIEYMTERNCDVTQIGGLLDEKGYGIAMRKNSPYRNALSEAVLRLQEQGKLTAMKTKWWKEKRGGGACSNAAEEGGAEALELVNVGGVFLLLIIGCLVAILINWVEFIFDVKSAADEAKKTSDDGAEELNLKNVGGVFFVLCVGSAFATLYGCIEWGLLIRKRSKEHEVPFKEEFMEELKFVMKCSGNTKTVRHRKSSSNGSKNSIITERSLSRGGTPKSQPKRGSSEPFLNMRVNGNNNKIGWRLNKNKNYDDNA
uniref:CSON013411 protein n=1 Tax=Culicoides sonorensis TaxID=179676 RepID=A0A336MCA3_CULSO